MEEAFSAVATLLDQLTAARAVHADLNVKNVLLAPARNTLVSARRGVVAHAIDVDVVRFHETATRDMVRARNVSRLERSMRKYLRQHDRSAHDAERAVQALRAALRTADTLSGSGT
jgi:Ser/Thr protein kinase RdoA (MazF antagonist)